MKSRIYVLCLKNFLKCAAINNSPMKNRTEKVLHAHVGSLPSVTSKGKFCLLVTLLLFCSAEATAVLVLHNSISPFTYQYSFTSQHPG